MPICSGPKPVGSLTFRGLVTFNARILDVSTWIGCQPTIATFPSPFFVCQCSICDLTPQTLSTYSPETDPAKYQSWSARALSSGFGGSRCDLERQGRKRAGKNKRKKKGNINIHAAVLLRINIPVQELEKTKFCERSASWTCLGREGESSGHARAELDVRDSETRTNAAAGRTRADLLHVNRRAPSFCRQILLFYNRKASTTT